MLLNIAMVLTALLFPRILIIVIALASDWFSQTYETNMWPILGWIFMPLTVLTYMAAQFAGGVEGWWIVAMVFAVMIDLGRGGNETNKRVNKRDTPGRSTVRS